MNVYVTGSAGKIGREAVKALRAAGHHVAGLDLRSGISDGVRTLACDCTDFGQVYGALSGVDTFPKPEAIVHLAGIPAPGRATDATTFAANTVSTYNIFSAAARLGIKRVVWGSSETILGLPFSTPPAFAPLDECHPDRPEWSYSLSKKLGETIADEFTRWHAEMTIVSLRFSNVFDASDYEQQRKVLVANPGARKANMWGYVDARDAGEACRLAVEADFSGHQRLIIAAADTIVDIPSAELMSTYYPEVPLRKALQGNASLLSSEAAGRMLGYHPQYSWRNQ